MESRGVNKTWLWFSRHFHPMSGAESRLEASPGHVSCIHSAPYTAPHWNWARISNNKMHHLDMCHVYAVLLIHHYTGTEPGSVKTKCITCGHVSCIRSALYTPPHWNWDRISENKIHHLDMCHAYAVFLIHQVVLDPDSVSACHQ